MIIDGAVQSSIITSAIYYNFSVTTISLKMLYRIHRQGRMTAKVHVSMETVAVALVNVPEAGTRDVQVHLTNAVSMVLEKLKIHVKTGAPRRFMNEHTSARIFK